MSQSSFPGSTVNPAVPSYGSDLSCVLDLDPSMRETSGLHLLAEAAARRLITARGTLIDDPNYGFDLKQFLGADLSKADLAKIGSQCDAELVKDERIVASQTTVSLTAGVLMVSTAITPSSGPTFTLVLAVSALTVALLAPTI